MRRWITGMIVIDECFFAFWERLVHGRMEFEVWHCLARNGYWPGGNRTCVLPHILEKGIGSSWEAPRDQTVATDHLSKIERMLGRLSRTILICDKGP